MLGLGQGWEVMGPREPEPSTWNNLRRSHRHRPVLAREQPRAWLGVEQHCSVWVMYLAFLLGGRDQGCPEQEKWSPGLVAREGEKMEPGVPALQATQPYSKHCAAVRMIFLDAWMFP